MASPRTHRAIDKIYTSQDVYDPNRRLESVFPPLPPTPRFDQCSTSVEYETLIPDRTPFRDGVFGPTSLKKLYEAPWYYPPNRVRRPDGLMYDVDTSRYNEFGGTLRKYGTKLYPFHHRSPHEVRVYTSVYPVPDIFEYSKYPTVSDGAWGR